MKTYLAKSILLLIMLGGTEIGLLMYNRILVLLSKVANLVGYSWASIIFLFVVGLLAMRSVIKVLAKDLKATNALNEINLIKIAKFFMGGFIGCYAAFSIVGTALLGIYLLFRNFFL